MDDSKETARNAAENGTAIHAAIQGWYEGVPAPADMVDHIDGARQELDKWTSTLGEMAWFPERSFSHPMGFGGKCDLSTTGGKGFVYAPGFVADVKTKEFGEKDDLKTWDEHAMQLSAYREGLNLPTARCAICYVSVTNPGLSKLIEIPEDELSRGWEMFTYLLGFWKSKNRFRCGYE
jgi:hypothetical protein